jgi:hypothetical protein
MNRNVPAACLTTLAATALARAAEQAAKPQTCASRKGARQLPQFALAYPRIFFDLERMAMLTITSGPQSLRA